MVLLAGLAAGYLASTGASRLHDRLLSALPDTSVENALEEPFIASLSTIYEHSRAQFGSVLNQGSEDVRKAEMEMDLLRLKDFHRKFFMHYFRWLDTGNAQSSVQYKLALGQFEATLDYLTEKYGNQSPLTPRQEAELKRFVHIPEQTDRTVRWARVVVMVLLFILLLGIPHMIRDNGYKKFAGSLLFDSLFRPNHISGLNRWHSLQRMAPLLVILYLFSLVVFTSFSSWRIPVLMGTLGLIPVFLFGALSRNRGKWPEMVVSFMAPRLPVIILLLVVVAIRGSVFFWYRIWGAAQFRLIMITLLTMLIFQHGQISGDGADGNGIAVSGSRSGTLLAWIRRDLFNVEQ